MNDQASQPNEKPDGPDGSPQAQPNGLHAPLIEPEPAKAAPEPKPGPAKAATLSSEAPKPPKPSLWARMLNKETRSGRAMRAAIRTLGFIVGFYALGFFTAYTLFFQPLNRSSQMLNAELVQLRSDLEQTQSELDKAALTFLGVEKQNQQLEADMQIAAAKMDVLSALVQVREARLKLALNDAAAARLALNQAEESLQKSLPLLVKQGVASSDTFTQLFELARTDLGRNMRLAEQDLERLTSELQLVSEGLD